MSRSFLANQSRQSLANSALFAALAGASRKPPALFARLKGDGKRRTTKRATVNSRTAKDDLSGQVRTEPPSLEDLEAIDALINEFFPIALSAKEDFALAIKAAHVTLELLDIHAQVLVNVARDLHEFSV
jgi:hypothetical protein